MINSAPTVSVIIPCYNLGAYLDQAVQSVLDQSFDDFEILIIDDGSTDPATRHLFDSYQRPRTRIFRTENRGLAEARNLGIREAKGLYVSCLDADDMLAPMFLQSAVEALKAERSFAFASCWLKAFGEAQFEWTPSTCDFPHLLAEDTVCTAALTPREALVEVGGYDPHMPVAGYEHWELAISLVERGLRGWIIPEYLFRYRIRPGSMSSSCTEPRNHALLMRYMVEKHSQTYRKYLAGVLETIERRTLEMMGREQGKLLPENPEQNDTIEFLESNLRGVLESRNWKLSRPLRQTFSYLKALGRQLTHIRLPAPKISVVVTCRDQGKELARALHSVRSQLGLRAEIIIVDDNSRDPLTRQILDWHREAGFKIVRTDGLHMAAAREAGLREARAPVLFAMGADQTVECNHLLRALETLEADPGVAFVSCPLRDDATGFVWRPESAGLNDLLSCPRLPFPILRRESLVKVGGYDASLTKPEQADWELLIRLVAQGQKGIVFSEPLVNWGAQHWSVGKDQRNGQSSRPLVREVVEKHMGIFEARWNEAILGQENQRRRFQAHLDAARSQPSVPTTLDTINWGGLRRLEPVSQVWGTDRGQPIDRYYIEAFLNRHCQDISGHVLEVKDPGYTRTFGVGVEKSDVVDIARNNPYATLVCDLTENGSLPEDTYDCFILTQTIHIVYDIRQVLKNALRALRPGGTLLATLPCVSRIDYESGREGDCWRFTPASAKRLFEEVFGAGQVEVEAFGNVLTCCGFLMGVSAGELAPQELDHHDPYFPLLLCVRAINGRPLNTAVSTRTPSAVRERGLVLLYHRIDQVIQDRWRLCVSAENFAAHLVRLSRSFLPVRLSELALMLQEGKLRHGAVAITFDDGYRDNVSVALPMLKSARIPATFFIAGEGSTVGDSFWWEVLDASLQKIDLDESIAIDLHQRLMVANADERLRILESLTPPAGSLPARLNITDLRKLASEPLAEIGAHGWSHRALAGLPVDEQRQEISANLQMLKGVTDDAICAFAYPFGGPFSSETKQILREAGIHVACTTKPEPVIGRSDLLALPRLEVGNWDGEKFEEKLRSLLDD